MTLQKLILYSLSWSYLIISQHLKSDNLLVQSTNWLGSYLFSEKVGSPGLSSSSLRRVMEGSHDVVVAVDEKFLFVGESHLGTAVFGKENLIADLDESLANGTVLLVSAGADSNDCAKVEAFFFARGENNTTLGLGDGLSFLDNNSVEQGSHSSECKHDLCISCVLSNLLGG